MAALMTTHSRAHCLFISTNKATTPYPVFPLGVAHLMGAVRQAGHRADYFDLLASGNLEELEGLLHTNDYDVIGLSIRNIDSVDSSSPQPLIGEAEKVMHCVREHSGAPVVLGGPGFSIMPEKLLAHLQADYGIVGEGERIFPRLLERILAKEVIHEKLFYAEIDGYPDCKPFYAVNSTEYYLNHGGMLNIQTKRGCCYTCSYCSYPDIEGRKLRCRPPEQIIEDVQRLEKDHGVRYLFFTDSVFNDPQEHYLEVAEALIRSGNNVPWCAFFRPQNLDTKKLRLLKRSGMEAMELGTDAATDETLAGLNKGFTFKEVVEVHRKVINEDIACAHFIVFGGPGETRETVRQGISNLDKLADGVIFAAIGIRIFPGTGIYNLALEKNIITPETDLISPIFYYSPDIDREYIDKSLHQSFEGKDTWVFPMEKFDSRIQFLHAMGHAGPLWNLILPRRFRQR